MITYNEFCNKWRLAKIFEKKDKQMGEGDHDGEVEGETREMSMKAVICLPEGATCSDHVHIACYVFISFRRRDIVMPYGLVACHGDLKWELQKLIIMYIYAFQVEPKSD